MTLNIDLQPISHTLTTLRQHADEILAGLMPWITRESVDVAIRLDAISAYLEVTIPYTESDPGIIEDIVKANLIHIGYPETKLVVINGKKPQGMMWNKTED